MVNSTTLAQTLASAAGVKIANAMTPRTDMPVTDEKLRLLVGEMGEQKSTFAQINPGIGNNLEADPNSPLQGDDIFFTYLMPGSQFCDRNGSYWEIDTYDWEGMLELHDIFLPRRRGVVSITDVRRSIAMWTVPVLQVVPPVPVGVDYGVVETREVS
jgi:hypothetical protein